MAPTFLLEILPEADAIKIFNGPNVIPSETYVLRGYVQLTTARRVGIRQISIQLEGVVRNMISAYPAEPAFDTQINPELWPASVYHANEDMPLLDRVMRRALLAAAGYASSKEIITRETTELFGDGMTTLMVGAGVIRWPFEITIPNAHKLPPSILLPQHSIHYALSAQLKLASIRDSLLVSFWNASFFFPGTASSRTNGSSRRPRRRRRLSHVSASSSTASSSSSSSDTSPAAHWDAEIMLRKSQKKKRQQMCRAYRPIQVRCHGYPSLQVLDQQPWIRYRGCRTGRLRYEVFMPKAVCLQQKTIDVICHFTPLCAETQIESIHMVLEQVSRFPLIVGTIKEEEPLEQFMISRSRRTTEMKHVVDASGSLDYLPLSISLESPLVSQDVDTLTLQISHKLRIFVFFVNNLERRMSLSFPIQISTVPISELACAPPHLCDPLHLNENVIDETLPSYWDVLHEGSPPAAFLDDDMPRHP